MIPRIAANKRQCVLFRLGLVEYETVWRFQRALIEHINCVKKGTATDDSVDYLIVVQHPSIYTLGRGASLKSLKFTPSNERRVVRVERGGANTYLNAVFRTRVLTTYHYTCIQEISHGMVQGS